MSRKTISELEKELQRVSQALAHTNKQNQSLRDMMPPDYMDVPFIKDSQLTHLDDQAKFLMIRDMKNPLRHIFKYADPHTRLKDRGGWEAAVVVLSKDLEDWVFDHSNYNFVVKDLTLNQYWNPDTKKRDPMMDSLEITFKHKGMTPGQLSDPDDFNYSLTGPKPVDMLVRAHIYKYEV